MQEMSPRAFAVFEFEIMEPLLTQLILLIDSMTAAPLTRREIRDANVNGAGVYQLSYTGKPVYVGKADSEEGLALRLARHVEHLRDRHNLQPDDVAFKAVHVPTFTAMDLESRLIKHYDTAWNGSGFGNNDPGRVRDRTVLKEDHFDLQFPIDIDREGIYLEAGDYSAQQALTLLRAQLPYVLRFKLARSVYEAARVTITAPTSVRGIVSAIVASLPKGWQAWKLPGRIILYDENNDYDFGELIARS